MTKKRIVNSENKLIGIFDVKTGEIEIKIKGVSTILKMLPDGRLLVNGEPLQTS